MVLGLGPSPLSWENQCPRSGLAWPISSSPVIASQGAVRTVVLAAEDTYQQYSGLLLPHSFQTPPKEVLPGPLPSFLLGPRPGTHSRGPWGWVGLELCFPARPRRSPLPSQQRKNWPKDVTPLFLLPMGRLVPGRMCTSL